MIQERSVLAATWNFVEATGKRKTVVMFFEKCISCDDIVKMFRKRHRSKKMWWSKRNEQRSIIKSIYG